MIAVRRGTALTVTALIAHNITPSLPMPSTQAACRRRIFTTHYRPEDAFQWERNVFHPPLSDSPNLPNYTVFTGPRGADAGSLEQLERQLGCYGDGPCVNSSHPGGFGLADVVMGGGCEGHATTCAAAFDRASWWITGSGPNGAGNAHANTTPPEELHAAMGERYLGVAMGEWDGGYVWQQQQDMHPNVGPADENMFPRFLSFFSFMERYVESSGNRFNALITNMMGAHYPVKSGMYSMTAGETAQGINNPQVLYSFIRGAAKQYGTRWWADVSTWNRFGNKEPYVPSATTGPSLTAPHGQSSSSHSMKQYAEPYPGAHLYCDQGSCTCPEGPNATCPSSGGCDGSAICAGTSYALTKRLVYQQIMYNSFAVGFEQPGLFNDSFQPGQPPPTLNTIGMIARAARNFSKTHGKAGLGVHLAPCAVLLDFFSGFVAPAGAQSGAPKSWLTWGGGVNYQAGDHLTSATFDLMYPGWADSALMHNESGFTVPTPFGDAMDVLLTDVESWLLSRYAVVIVASKLRQHSSLREVRDKLERQIHQGGTVVITAANLDSVGELMGVSVHGCEEQIPANSTVSTADGGIHKEGRPFTLCSLRLPSNATVLASVDRQPPTDGNYEEFTAASGRTHYYDERTGHVIRAASPVAAMVPAEGSGRLVVLASPMGLSDELSMPAAELQRWSCWRTWSRCPRNNTFGGEDHSIPQPFEMLQHVQHLISSELRATMRLFSVGRGLAFSTNRVRAGEFLLTVSNQFLRPMPMNIESHIGEIIAVEDIPLDVTEKQFQGWLPCGPFNRTRAGPNTLTLIDTADVRVIRVKVNENAAEVQPMQHQMTPRLPSGIGLPLRDVRSVRAEILKRPTFLANFDTVILDHRSLNCVTGQETPWQRYWDCSPSTIQRADRHWLSRNGAGPQGLHVYVDLTGAINWAPDLQIARNNTNRSAPDMANCGNLCGDWDVSMRVLRSAVHRAADLGARGVIVALHSYTGTDLNNNTIDDIGFASAVRFVADEAEAAGVPQVILRQRGRFSGGGAWRTDGAGVNGFSADRTLADVARFLERVGRPSNVKLGLSLPNLLAAGETPTTTVQKLRSMPSVQLGMLFFAAAINNPFAQNVTNNVFTTLNGRVYDTNEDHRAALSELLRALKRAHPGVPVSLDSVLETPDHEYLEATALRRALAQEVE